MAGASLRSFRLQLQKWAIPQCFSMNLRSCFASSDVQFSLVRHDSANHVSRAPEKLQFSTETRGLVIQQGMDHLRSLQEVKIKDSVKQICINDQYKSKGMDEKSLFLYEKLPPLKFNNPEVPILCTRDETKPWRLSIQLSEEKENVEINLEGRTAHQIFNDFYNVACEDT